MQMQSKPAAWVIRVAVGYLHSWGMEQWGETLKTGFHIVILWLELQSVQVISAGGIEVREYQ